MRNRRVAVLWDKRSFAISPISLDSMIWWYDFSDASMLYTDAGVTRVVNDEDLIYQVNDKSGNDNHAYETNGDYRPKYKINIRNGMSVARFDGNDALRTTLLSTVQYFTIFVVCNRTGGGDNAGPMCMDYNTSNQRVFQFRWNTALDAELIVFDSSANPYFDTEPVEETAMHILSGVRGSNYCQVFVNGGSNGATATSGTASSKSDFQSIGDAFRFSVTEQRMIGDICEVLMYNTVLLDVERQEVEQYLREKWSLY